MLPVRVGRGRAPLVALAGELDLANAATAEASSSRLSGGSRRVVDLRQLEFIDSTGIALWSA